jgi:hypothetical protein
MTNTASPDAARATNAAVSQLSLLARVAYLKRLSFSAGERRILSQGAAGSMNRRVAGLGVCCNGNKLIIDVFM